MFFEVINIAINITFTAFLFAIFSNILTIKQNRFIQLLFFISLYSTTASYVYAEEMTGCIVILLTTGLAVLLCCEDSTLKKISCLLLFYPVIIGINFLTEDIGLLIWLYLFHKDMSPMGMDLLHTLLMAVRIPIWYLIYRFTKNWLKQIAMSFTGKMWAVIDTICVTSFIGIITAIYTSEIMKTYQIYPFCIACIVTGLGICYLCACLSEHIRNTMELHTLKYQQSYYEELEIGQLKIRKLRHDIKNHLNVVLSLLHQQKEEEAKHYLLDLSDELSPKQRVFCQNTIVNAVLNAKYFKAEEKKITCDFKIELNDKIAIDPVSLCSLFANTLDNALEACEKIPDPDSRKITLKARYQNGYFCYEIQNTKENAIITDHGRILTAKSDTISHGLGLQNIKDMISRYRGTIDIRYTDQDFCVTVFIPIG